MWVTSSTVKGEFRCLMEVLLLRGSVASLICAVSCFRKKIDKGGDCSSLCCHAFCQKLLIVEADVVTFALCSAGQLPTT